MSETENETPRQFSFAFAEADLLTYRNILAARRRSAGVGFMFGVMFSPIVPALCVLAAFELRLIGHSALGPVLLAALAGFIAGGLAWHVGARIEQRRLAQLDFAASRSAKGMRTYSFDDSGMVSASSTIESRVRWSAVTSIENTPAMVLIWLDRMQGFFVPARVFANAAAQAEFAASISRRIKAGRAKVAGS
jgi:hypothetical protein